MKGRDFTSDKYRYGFNGKEKDDEVKGASNSYDFGARIYDSRLGRFLSIDPEARNFPWNSPYSYAENRPIDGIDLDGKEWTTTKTYDVQTGVFTISNTVKVKIVNNSDLLDDFNKDNYMQKVKGEFEKTFTQFDKDKGIQYTATLEYEFVDAKDITSSDFSVTLSSGAPGEGSNIGFTQQIGNTQSNELKVLTDYYVEIPEIPGTYAYSGEDPSSSLRTFVHELGHTLGLFHPNSAIDYNSPNPYNLIPEIGEKYVNKQINDNIMIGDKIASYLGVEPGFGIESEQLKFGSERISQQQADPSSATEIKIE